MKCNILLNMPIVRRGVVLIRVLTKFVRTLVIKHASYQRLCWWVGIVGLWNCKFTEDVIHCTMTILNWTFLLQIKIGDTSLQSFLALLEYLYTDHAPIEEGDSVEIMVLADRFCLPRLVTLCELYITKKVDATIQKRVADGTSDVINLLLTSQVRSAFLYLKHLF